MKKLVSDRKIELNPEHSKKQEVLIGFEMAATQETSGTLQKRQKPNRAGSVRLEMDQLVFAALMGESERECVQLGVAVK